MGEETGIGWAVNQMQNGAKIARAGWNGKGMWIALQVPDANSEMGHPYCYISGVGGVLVPWTPSQTDLLAYDWEIVE